MMQTFLQPRTLALCKSSFKKYSCVALNPWLNTRALEVNLKNIYSGVYISGVPIIDYNRKSVDYWHNPSARLKNFHSD
jgi:hypothetical protein